MKWLRKHPYLGGGSIFILLLLVVFYSLGYRFSVLFPYDNKCGEQHIAFVLGKWTNDIKLDDVVLTNAPDEGRKYLGTITALPSDSLVYNSNNIQFSNVTRKGKFPTWYAELQGENTAFAIPKHTYWLWGYNVLDINEFSRDKDMSYVNRIIHQNEIIAKVNYIININLWPYYEWIYQLDE